MPTVEEAMQYDYAMYKAIVLLAVLRRFVGTIVACPPASIGLLTPCCVVGGLAAGSADRTTEIRIRRQRQTDRQIRTTGSDF